MGSLKQLVSRLSSQPRTPELLPQRVAWCRQALELIQPGEHRELWAWLHFEIAYGLEHLPAARADDLTEALWHYEQALQVYTTETFFKPWVNTRFNMARLYERQPGGGLERAIVCHEEIVQQRTDALPAGVWAESYTALARLYRHRMAGDHNDNIAWGIACAQQALVLWDRQTQPVEWAEAQDLLGLLYRRCWSDEPGTELERSLACHQAALDALRPFRQTHPTHWARVQHNLGAAWIDRLDGRRDDNLAHAVVCLQDALTVRTRQNHPQDWADTQYTLALALIERTAADPAANVRRARHLVEELAFFHDPQTSPEKWALCQRALGDTHMRSVDGERAENVERAILHYQEVLKVGLSAHEQAATEHNLAVAYGERLLGQRIANLRRAVERGQSALARVDPRARLRWALIKVDLIDLLWKLALADPAQAAEWLEQAIAHGEEVIAAYGGRLMFHRLALAHYNLGNAYGDRLCGQRAGNQCQAITHYEQALAFYTPENYPARWADTHNNLAVTYQEWTNGDPVQNRQKAVEHYERAMRVLEQGTLPASARRGARNLGNLYLQEHAWAQAARAFQTAIEAAEVLYQTSLLRQSQEAELGQNADLYRCAAYALARAGQFEEAVVTLEQGRARLVADALARDAAQLEALRSVHPCLYQAYKAVALRLDTQTAQAYELDPAGLLRRAEEVRADRQQLAGLIDQIRQQAGIDLAPTWTFVDLTQLLDPQMPLVYLVATPTGGMALILHEGQVETIWLEVSDREINRRVSTWLNVYTLRTQNDQAGQWWLDEIDATLSWLWDRLVGAPVKWLKRCGYCRAAWAPTGLLGLLPLHAACHREKGQRQYAIDEIAFACAPSARALAHTQRVAKTVPADDLFAVDNPDGTLRFSEAEVNAVASHFPKDQRWIARKDRATYSTVKSALPQCSVLHFSCHGRSSLDDPLHSKLQLYGHVWTVSDLLVLETKPRVRLAFLSACETGIPGMALPDEVIGWATGFIQVGAAGVVSTLWSVGEQSTARLVARFYQNWKGRGQMPMDALAEAQRWLRDKADGGRWSHPYYWAGFTLTGV
jgi:CHAT domain-containing protein